MTQSYIGFGSNVGDRILFVRRAVEELDDTAGVRVTRVSGLYETSPVGGPPQRSFVNCVASIDTDLTPRQLLVVCKEIEDKLGRDASEIRWGPRIIDLDVLTYGEDKVSEPDLEIPHPRIRERRFVLVPLLEIAPHETDPWGTPFADSLDEAEGNVDFLESW